MFSSTFIDRPRLAFVIAIVITLAGIIAITAIPIAQFPDIVPPQVTLSATYPGADAEVIETTVAQPIEEQVNGIDSKSISRLQPQYCCLLRPFDSAGSHATHNTGNARRACSHASGSCGCRGRRRRGRSEWRQSP